MTSMAEPNRVSWMARRSDSFVAQAYISSMVLGGCAHVEAPERWRYVDVPDIDLKAEVAGAALAAALVVAVEIWGRGGCTDYLGQIVAEAVNLVRSGLAQCRDAAHATWSLV